MEYCPGDLWVIAKNGSAIVTWDEPHFSDNVEVVKVQESNGHRPGQTLLWGIYQIAYVAYDAAGNAATCTFKISVLCKNFRNILNGMIVNILLLQLNFVLNFQHQLVVHKLAKIGAPEVNSKFAKSVAIRI